MRNVKDSRNGDAIPPEDTLNDRRRLSSSVLFGTRNEIVIVHNDEEYRLRITSNGKLILTK
jgi:hemin uptake protein HemP